MSLLDEKDDETNVESISDFASSRNQRDLDIVVEPAASRLNYEEISHGDCMVHLSFDNDLPDGTYINVSPGNAAESEDRKYACLVERRHDHQANTYAALKLNSIYEN